MKKVDGEFIKGRIALVDCIAESALLLPMEIFLITAVNSRRY